MTDWIVYAVMVGFGLFTVFMGLLILVRALYDLYRGARWVGRRAHKSFQRG